MEAVRSADGIVAVSRDLSETLIRLGVKPDKVRTIYDGVDRRLFHPGDKAQERAILNLSPEEKAILFVGNLVPVKAVDVLIRASAEPMRVDSTIRLVIVGQGPLRTELKRLAQELGIVDRVRFVGPIPHAELPRWFRATDLFVLPSHSEGVPNVLLEASACGVPWVASRVGGIPEIAHLGLSRLVQPNAPVELAQAIREMLATPRKDLPPGPRAREEAVAELQSWLNAVQNR
jgi:glycosyltransferase involved in cell wall biosynthesis